MNLIIISYEENLNYKDKYIHNYILKLKFSNYTHLQYLYYNKLLRKTKYYDSDIMIDKKEIHILSRHYPSFNGIHLSLFGLFENTKIYFSTRYNSKYKSILLHNVIKENMTNDYNIIEINKKRIYNLFKLKE